MDDTLLREQLRQSEQRNEALGREMASLRATLDHVLQEFGAFRRDYEALVDATRIITERAGRASPAGGGTGSRQQPADGHAVGTA